MNRKIARIISAFILVLTAVSALSGCTNASKTKLTNHMTALEKERSDKTEFQLLNKPWEEVQPEETDYSYLEDKICLCPGIGAIVHGRTVYNALPDKDYDGGAGEVIYLEFDVETYEQTETRIVYDDFEDLRSKLRVKYDELIASGFPGVPANEEYSDLIALYEAVINGDAEMIDRDFLDKYRDYFTHRAAQITKTACIGRWMKTRSP